MLTYAVSIHDFSTTTNDVGHNNADRYTWMGEHR